MVSGPTPTSRSKSSKLALMATKTSDNHPFIKEALRTLEENGSVTHGKISFYTHPPLSPNLNVLVLGLFNSLQAKHYGDEAPKDSIEIISMLQKTYEHRKPMNTIQPKRSATLNMLSSLPMIAPLRTIDKMPHMNKKRLE